MRRDSLSARIMLIVAVAVMTAISCAKADASVSPTFKVDIYNSFTSDGDGSPFTGLNSSFQRNWDNYQTIVEVQTPVGTIPVFLDLPAMAPHGLFDYSWYPKGANTGFGAQLTGWFIAPSDRSYSFATSSDDGSVLFVDGNMVVDNSGMHGPQNISNYAFVTAGLHKITVNYFEDGKGLSGLTALLDPSLQPASAPTPTVPLPPAVFLLFSGMAGLVFARFRKQ